MRISRAITLVRNWSILVDHDIQEDHILHLAQLIHNETEKEKQELVKDLDALIESPTPKSL